MRVELSTLLAFFYIGVNDLQDKALLNLEETAQYLNIGKTKAREILKSKNSTFTVRIGNRLYANKKLLDSFLERAAKYQINI